MKAPLASLKDPQLEQQLWKDGYVVVPFFDLKTTKELIEYYKSFASQDDNGIYASSHSTNIEQKKAINNKIKEAYSDKVEELFIDPFIMGGTFVVKPPGTGVSHPHLDWSLVHEGPFRSCNVWIPLIDLTKDNGVIEVLPGSHKLFPTYRGPNIPDRTNDLQQFLWDTMTQLFLTAGQALIYDHRLIHGSGDNLTDKIRRASACAVTNKQAVLRLYYLDESNAKIEAFTGNNSEYILSNVRFEKPTEMTSLGYIDNSDQRQLTTDDLGFLNLPANQMEQTNEGFLSRLFHFGK